MIKKYCQKCGNRMEYKVAEKPKFCSQCGISFMGARCGNDKNPGTEPKKTPPPHLNEEVKELDVEDFDPESLDGLNVEISPFFQLKGEKFGNIIGTSAGGKIEDDDWNPSLLESDPEKFQEEFRKEAGSIRKQPAKNNDQK